MNSDEIRAFFGEPIHTYTRAQALADGALVDVTRTAADARFRVPVALTRSAWSHAVEWDGERPELQDEEGRLWDVVDMAGHAVRQAPGEQRITFKVLRIPNEDRGRRWNDAELIELQLHIGPGDAGEPVITIMTPGED